MIRTEAPLLGAPTRRCHDTMPQKMKNENITKNLRGLVPESWACIDCGVNTAPGMLNRAEAEAAQAQGGMIVTSCSALRRGLT